MRAGLESNRGAGDYILSSNVAISPRQSLGALTELGWNRDAIEPQLAHAERDNVRAAYNFAEHLPERLRMMQAWADYLAGLWEGGKVTLIKRAVAA